MRLPADPGVNTETRGTDLLSALAKRFLASAPMFIDQCRGFRHFLYASTAVT